MTIMARARFSAPVDSAGLPKIVNALVPSRQMDRLDVDALFHAKTSMFAAKTRVVQAAKPSFRLFLSYLKL